jgi:hypothetical protein
MATLVRFYKDKAEVFAVFPQLFHNKRLYSTKRRVCYSHIGQHSVCNDEYLKECKKAKEPEYQALKKELEEVGYKLKIITT